MPHSTAMNGRANGDAVILTGGEHVSVLGAVRGLRAAGYAPWVAVHEQGTYASRSWASEGILEIASPWDDAGAFVAGIAAAAQRVGALAILPGTEYGMETLARHAGELPDEVVVAVPPLPMLADVTDKRRLLDFAARVGFPTPPTRDVSLDDLPVVLPFRFPVVVKSPRSEFREEDGVVRHHGTQLASSMHELEYALAELPRARGLIQPFWSDPLVSVAGVFWDDRVVSAVQSRADRVWPQPCGSISHAVTVELDGRLVDRVGTLLRSMGWRGLFQVDLFQRGDDYAIIDLNPRFYTSIGHATYAGLNLAGIWLDLLLGRQPEVPDSYRVGVHYQHEEGDLRAVGQMLLHGPRGEALRALVPHPETAHAVFSPTDPWPLLTSVSRFMRRGSRTGKDVRKPLGRGKASARGRAVARSKAA
ncbi:MAG TPA: ATP-grasp domain-containing protein [Candidatus Limnocylindrales bacterium]|nr:ATP-grasp domain-containing protein [Candidatus Limnocylindrales bacterium]